MNEGLEWLGKCQDDYFGVFSHSGLESVEIPKSVKIIGKDVFQGCKDLKSIKFEEGLQKIGRYAFSDCAVECLELPSSLEEVQERAFFDNPLRRVEFGCESRLKSVGDYAFGRERRSEGQIKREDVRLPEGAEVASTAFEDRQDRAPWE